jgi:hypothetical protein
MKGEGKKKFKWKKWQCSVSHVKTAANMTAHKLSCFLITLRMNFTSIFFVLRKKDANIFTTVYHLGGGGLWTILGRSCITTDWWAYDYHLPHSRIQSVHDHLILSPQQLNLSCFDGQESYTFRRIQYVPILHNEMQRLTMHLKAMWRTNAKCSWYKSLSSA